MRTPGALLFLLQGGLFAAQQFSVPFSADSGSPPAITSFGLQTVQKQLVFQFPGDFPINPQDCLNPVVIGIPCKVVSASATITFTPANVSIAFQDPASGSAQGSVELTITFLAGMMATVVSTKSFGCNDPAGCNLQVALDPQSKTDLGGTLYFSPNSSTATFNFIGVVGDSSGGAQTTVQFGNVNIQGQVVFEVQQAPPVISPVPASLTFAAPQDGTPPQPQTSSFTAIERRSIRG